jgi:teichuronic acid biosynthesis glycosyltransferase TuaG
MINNELDLVSIIMPAYNAEKFIEESIKSVLSQTYSNFELIIINDKSTDKTIDIISKFALFDKRIKSINNESNIGVAQTRNYGVSVSLGLWVAFIDSDDCWDKDKLTIQIDFMRRNNSLFSYSGSRFIDENGKYYVKVIKAPFKKKYNTLKLHNTISCSSVIVSSHVMKLVKMKNDKIHEDFAAWLEVLRIVKYAYGTNDTLLTYRIHNSSKSSKKLKSFKMTYFVYKEIGINSIFALVYTISHLLFSVLKYRGLKYLIKMEK